MKKILVALAVLSLAFAALLAVLKGRYETTGFRNEPFYNVPQGSATPTANDTLTLVSWNIAYAFGSGSDGSGYAPKSRAEITSRLVRMARLLDSLNADIALLQEVDFGSDRSHRIDQAAFLARETRMAHYAISESWYVNHLPYPFWPFDRQWGRIQSGAAVLSAWPVTANQAFFYDKPSERNPFYRLFYLFRYRQLVDIATPGAPVRVINNHLEAFEPGTRMKQALELAAAVNAMKDQPVLAVGGDMNSLPAVERRRDGFAFAAQDRYEGDSTLAYLNRMSEFREAVTDSAYLSEPDAWYTFPAAAPNRRLDYLFIHQRARVLDVQVVQTGELSDHLPVVVRLVRSR